MTRRIQLGRMLKTFWAVYRFRKLLDPFASCSGKVNSGAKEIIPLHSSDRAELAGIMLELLDPPERSGLAKEILESLKLADPSELGVNLLEWLDPKERIEITERIIRSFGPKDKIEIASNMLKLLSPEEIVRLLDPIVAFASHFDKFNFLKIGFDSLGQPGKIELLISVVEKLDQKDRIRLAESLDKLAFNEKKELKSLLDSNRSGAPERGRSLASGETLKAMPKDFFPRR